MKSSTTSSSNAIYGSYASPSNGAADGLTWSDCGTESATLKHRHIGAGSRCQATGDITAIDTGGFAAIIGEPRWTNKPLCDVAERDGDARALLEGYNAYGKGVLDHIRGAFAVALADEKGDTFLLAVDRLGHYPIYYSEVEDSIRFGSTGEGLAIGPNSGNFDEMGLYSYVYFHMIPSPLSIYPGVRKLPPGHRLVVNDGQCLVESFWSPRFDSPIRCNFAQAGELLKDQLRGSVERAIKGEPAVGAFLSGGLDSSTVAGMLAELSDGEANAYAIGFAAQGYDEMPYARITARHFGIKLHEYYVSPDDIVTALPDIVASYDEPFGNSSALPAYFCAKMAAQDGVTRLLAGDGGDELFAGNERYAKQAVFDAYSAVPAALRKNLIEPLLAHLPDAFPLAGKARSYVAQANTPLPDRLQSYNFLHRIDPNTIFSDELMANVDIQLPIKLQRERYAAPCDASELNRMLFFDWKFTLADNDLRKVSRMCDLAGVDVSYPMLDDELIDFSCTIPDIWKLKGNKLRHFYKKSLTGWLPDETLNKKKHGFGLPFGVWMQDHKPLQSLAYDSLSSLKQRDYFKPSFIEDAVNLHQKGHAAYYGELIWILMVLELWLQQRAPR